MTNTPPLESIVFSERMGHKAADGTVTHRYVTYEGKLEGKNFYLRQISDVSGIGSPLRGDESFFVGYNEGLHWTGNGGWITKWHEADGEKSLENNGPAAMSRVGFWNLQRILQAGINMTEPGSLRFSGTNFTANGWYGDPVDGDLIFGDGRLQSIRTARSNNPNVVGVLSYTYGEREEVPPFFPSTIHHELHTSKGISPRGWGNTYVLRLVIATNDIPDEVFGPDYYLNKAGAAPIPVVVRHKGTMLRETPQGYVQVKEGPRNQAEATVQSLGRRVMHEKLFVGLAVLVLMILVVVIYQRK